MMQTPVRAFLNRSPGYLESDFYFRIANSSLVTAMKPLLFDFIAAEILLF
jgi:hypothetical protein